MSALFSLYSSLERIDLPVRLPLFTSWRLIEGFILMPGLEMKELLALVGLSHVACAVVLAARRWSEKMMVRGRPRVLSRSIHGHWHGIYAGNAADYSQRAAVLSVLERSLQTLSS